MHHDQDSPRSQLIAIIWLSCHVATLAAGEPVTKDTPRTFPEFTHPIEWQRHANDIRHQVQVSCGLWPMPEKTPLNARVFDRVERSGYSIEKVELEIHPGVFLAGNLFRPIDGNTKPRAAVLNPHGHWPGGRLANDDTASVIARCITFSRMGMVAFAYDTFGYNDSTQFSPRTSDGSLVDPQYNDGHRLYAQAPEDQLWGISLMGLQTWASIRALDFLVSLEDVDAGRVGVTGGSGGATQAYVLGVLDDRISAQAPVVMVSHTMQGGCWCENAPGLRVRFSNVEFAAAAAPRPQLLVAATGDWSRATMEVEGPHIASIYDLLEAPGAFRFTIFDAPHNYNRNSRETVYAFMAEHLLPENRTMDTRWETPFPQEDPESMRIRPDDKLPAQAISGDTYKSWLKDQLRKQLAAIWPDTATQLSDFKDEFRPFYRAILQLPPDPQSLSIRVVNGRQLPGGTRVSAFEVSDTARAESVKLRVYQPQDAGNKVVVISHPLGTHHSADHAGELFGFAQNLIEAGINVVLYDGYGTGANRELNHARHSDIYTNFFTTYNRTDLQEHVLDLVNVSAFLRSIMPGATVILLGVEEAGLWSTLAAPAADAVVADLNRMNIYSDDEWVAPQRFLPAIYRMGTITGPLLLAAPNPLFLHNTAGHYSGDELTPLYAQRSDTKGIQIRESRTQTNDLLEWINEL